MMTYNIIMSTLNIAFLWKAPGLPGEALVKSRPRRRIPEAGARRPPKLIPPATVNHRRSRLSFHGGVHTLPSDSGAEPRSAWVESDKVCDKAHDKEKSRFFIQGAYRGA